ncbi:MAG: AMP-binding protein [Muribaculaceae bacterium]|nr:AMP-binding protein [Muribaculaceae bacterium]
MKDQPSLNAYLQQAIVENWDKEALTNLNAQTYLYRDIARKIVKIKIMFESGNLHPGDKVAICGHNSAEWVIAFVAVMYCGCVAVPILNDFTPNTIHHLVNHSDAKVLFVDESIWKHLSADEMHGLIAAVRISDYELLLSRKEEVDYARRHLNEEFGKMFPERFTREDIHFPTLAPTDIVLINYTAGSTGFSKGVMLSERVLWSNIQFTIDGLTFLHPGDGMLCLLPLAHMYGLMVEVLHTLVKGCHIYLLGKTPSPKILLGAFAVVRPKLIIAVPLIIEKIIKTRVFPKLHKPLMRILTHLPLIKKKVMEKVRQNLMTAFGGNLQEMIIGGAGLAKDVEEFLRGINFPVTVGYGMTECGPLISYCPHNTQRQGSCGKVVDRMEAIIDSPDPITLPGVLWVKGDNVMAGYYKNPEATNSVLKDGWLNTEDICQMDQDGYIYIRGRDKNMILGPSGQNIYPEEIEALLNNYQMVGESLVRERNGKLEALIVPNYDYAKDNGINDNKLLTKELERILAETNKALPSFSQLAGFKIQENEFEKTPKRSIKRYLYK